MTTITAYRPLMDGFEILTDDKEDPNFGFGSTVHGFDWHPGNDALVTGGPFSDGTHRPLLWYRIDPSGSASKIKLVVTINDEPTGSGVTISGTESRLFIEIISTDFGNGGNKIRFRVEGGKGHLTLSDVIIFWKRNPGL